MCLPIRVKAKQQLESHQKAVTKRMVEVCFLSHMAATVGVPGWPAALPPTAPPAILGSLQHDFQGLLVFLI